MPETQQSSFSDYDAALRYSAFLEARDYSATVTCKVTGNVVRYIVTWE